MLHSVIAPLLAAATLTGGGGPADPAPTIPPSARPAGAVLIAGVVRDEHGAPVAGPVSVSVMPRDVETGDTYPVVAQGVADASGQFQATVTDAATLSAIADRQEGWVETVTTSDNAASVSSGVRSVRVWDDGGRLRVTPQSVARRAAENDVTPAPVTPMVDLKVAPPIAGGTVRTGKAPACHVTPLFKIVDEDVSTGWGVVGELNNAYNDGTSATFFYGRAGELTTSVGIAVALSKGKASGSFSIDDMATITKSASVEFPAFKRRLARKLRTGFRYKRTIEERSCPGRPETLERRTTVRAIAWNGGSNIDVKQPAALDQCNARVLKNESYAGGTTFTRDRNEAATYIIGGEAFGVALRMQSGYSKNVVSKFSFGGRASKKHYLCGADGVSSATRSGRIFSGAAR